MENSHVTMVRCPEMPPRPGPLPVLWSVACAFVLSGCLMDFDAADDGGSGQPDSAGCIDNDSDGFGAGCALGADCDDSAPGILGPCTADGCPEGWELVPAGTFRMGCDEADHCWESMTAESPGQQVDLDAVCVQKTEVSVALYRACMEAGACTGTPDDTSADSFCNWTPTASTRENHPINCISWSEAKELCEVWLGADLLTEAQWEKAARGEDGRTYPWGNVPAPSCDQCNFDVDGSGGSNTLGCGQMTQGPGTWEVASQPESGASPYGVQDMTGNVYEWVQDCYDPGFYGLCGEPCYEPVNLCSTGTRRVIRGGAYSTADHTYLRSVWRGMLEEQERVPHVGLRCGHEPRI